MKGNVIALASGPEPTVAASPKTTTEERMPSSEQICSAVTAYAEAFRTADKERFYDVLAEGVVQEDPVGGAPRRGRDDLAEFFDTISGLCERIEFEVRELYVSGDEVAIVFTIVQHRRDGMLVTLDGVDTFRVDNGGKVILIRGYSSPRTHGPGKST